MSPLDTLPPSLSLCLALSLSLPPSLHVSVSLSQFLSLTHTHTHTYSFTHTSVEPVRLGTSTHSVSTDGSSAASRCCTGAELARCCLSRLGDSSCGMISCKGVSRRGEQTSKYNLKGPSIREKRGPGGGSISSVELPCKIKVESVTV